MANTEPAGLAAPHWVRWAGVPLAGICALFVGLSGLDAAGRNYGLLAAAIAAAFWTAAVLVGAIKIRERNRRPANWTIFTKYIFGFIPAEIVGHSIPGSRTHLVTGTANYLCGAIAGFAVGSVVVRVIQQRRSQ